MAEWSRDTPWRQGHLLPEEAIAKLGLCPPENTAGCLALVISHDCDIANESDQEPAVEIIIGHSVPKAEGQYTYAKNARKLHLEFDHGEKATVGDFVATNKKPLPKAALVEFQPRGDVRLSPDGRSILQRWLAARYRRSAFPDEFERRLSGAGLKDRIQETLKSSGPCIWAVFFYVDGGEDRERDGDEDIYVLDILLVHTTTEDPEKAFAAASKAASDLEVAFKKKFYVDGKGWRSIELRDCSAISDEAMTVRQSQILREWRLEHISLRDTPPQAMLGD